MGISLMTEQMINTCSPNKGLLRSNVILYYCWKGQAALLSLTYSHGTDRKENTLWTVSNKACIVVPCLVVTQQRSLLPLSKETATVYRVYSCMKNSTQTVTEYYLKTIQNNSKWDINIKHYKCGPHTFSCWKTKDNGDKTQAQASPDHCCYYGTY
jgi:hypothetical protein